MKKQAYMKPTMHVVKIQQQSIICSSLLNSVNSNLDDDDAITIDDDTPAGNGFWGR